MRSVQALDLLDNFVFDSLWHSEINVGNGISNVKGTACRYAAQLSIRNVL